MGREKKQKCIPVFFVVVVAVASGYGFSFRMFVTCASALISGEGATVQCTSSKDMLHFERKERTNGGTCTTPHIIDFKGEEEQKKHYVHPSLLLEIRPRRPRLNANAHPSLLLEIKGREGQDQMPMQRHCGLIKDRGSQSAGLNVALNFSLSETREMQQNERERE